MYVQPSSSSSSVVVVPNFSHPGVSWNARVEENLPVAQMVLDLHSQSPAQHIQYLATNIHVEAHDNPKHFRVRNTQRKPRNIVGLNEGYVFVMGYAIFDAQEHPDYPADFERQRLQSRQALR